MTASTIARDRGLRSIAALGCVATMAACGGDPRPLTAFDEVTTSVGADGSDPAAVPTSIEPGNVVIVDSAEPVAFHRTLLGTNVPAWIGPERLADPEFQAETVASGTTLLRMPGGSWSNAYDWLGCELGEADECFWTWAARPSDFIDFMQATGIAGQWTVSINETAQAAAAAVAFFNGEVDDLTPIGTDRDGVEWGTVGSWAQLRSSGGNPDPVGIEYWEVGNEVYGGKPATGGSECASFGWEDVWTCDGATYVAGNDEHDGYLTIRDAMIGVDPGIEVGAVGVGNPDGWGDWGNEVIDGAGDALDFYVVHDYGFNASPDASETIERPGELWPPQIAAVRDRLPSDVPIAVTEYNLVYFAEGDTEAAMITAANAFFIADTVGQLARSGVTIANQWNLANGGMQATTDYGLLDLERGVRRPQFEGLAAWRNAGTSLYPALVDDDHIHVYPTRHDDGRWSIVAINFADQALETLFTVGQIADGTSVETRSAFAAGLDDQNMSTTTATGMIVDGELALDLPATSITTIDISAATDGV